MGGVALGTGNLGIPVLLVGLKRLLLETKQQREKGAQFLWLYLVQQFSVVHQRASACINVPPLLLTFDLFYSSFFLFVLPVSLCLCLCLSLSHLPSKLPC